MTLYVYVSYGLDMTGFYSYEFIAFVIFIIALLNEAYLINTS